jgi:hypothetical protein
MTAFNVKLQVSSMRHIEYSELPSVLANIVVATLRAV